MTPEERKAIWRASLERAEELTDVLEAAGIALDGCTWQAMLLHVVATAQQAGMTLEHVREALEEVWEVGEQQGLVS